LIKLKQSCGTFNSRKWRLSFPLAGESAPSAKWLARRSQGFKPLHWPGEEMSWSANATCCEAQLSELQAERQEAERRLENVDDSLSRLHAAFNQLDCGLGYFIPSG